MIEFKLRNNSFQFGYFQIILESGSQFKDSVVHVQFSNDGMYLAAADLSGVIKVWKLNGDIQKNREIIWEFETSDISVSYHLLLLNKLIDLG